jgi:hypothetical protein
VVWFKESPSSGQNTGVSQKSRCFLPPLTLLSFTGWSYACDKFRVELFWTWQYLILSAHCHIDLSTETNIHT